MKPISDEQLRILVAAAQRRLRMTEPAGRYVIDGEDRPDRRERERLVKRGMLNTVWAGPATLTEKGIEALRSAPLAEDQPDPGEQLQMTAEMPERAA